MSRCVISGKGIAFTCAIALFARHLSPSRPRRLIVLCACYLFTLVLFALPAVARFDWPPGLVYVLRYSSFAVISTTLLFALGLDAILKRFESRPLHFAILLALIGWAGFVQWPAMRHHRNQMTEVGTRNIEIYNKSMTKLSQEGYTSGKTDVLDYRLNPEFDEEGNLKQLPQLFFGDDNPGSGNCPL